MIELNLLTAISPIDGRYRTKVDSLANYFSEYALIRYRVLVEIEYFIALCEIPLEQLKPIDKGIFPKLRNVYENFSLEDAQKVKDTERVTNHDVKAVEYFIKDKFDELGLNNYKEFIHFGLTSQDINNTAIPLSIKKCLDEVYYPELGKLIAEISKLAKDWENIPMLAKTRRTTCFSYPIGKRNYGICKQIGTAT